jgi:tetratricopeptide (TPR) repeat protein
MFPTAVPQVQQLVQRITNYLNSGQLAAAERDLSDLARVAPRNSETFRMRGQVRTLQGRFVEAEQAFATAYQVVPTDLNLLIAISQLRFRQGRFDLMINVLEQALKVKPDFPPAIGLMANARRRQGQPKLALKLLERIPRNAGAAITAAWAHHDLEEWERVLEVISPVLSGPDPGPAQRAQAHHVRGLALERLGRYEAAMASYTAGKSAIPLRYDFGRYTSWLAAVKETYSAEAWPTLARSTNTSETPVFIAGMPRSGTTLLEAILSSHPQVADAGEIDATRRLVEGSMKPELVDSWPKIVPATFNTDLVEQWAKRYLEATIPYGPTATRIIDKHLYNWIYVGLFGQMFPNARVIHIRRDPLDVGISCFERVSATAVPWSADLTQLGTVIRLSEDLMSHWKSFSPLPIHTVEYEELVRNQEAETRKLLDFLGLPWDPAVLKHFDKESLPGKNRESDPPPTMGSEQAAKPVYDSSIGRGARFGAVLDPLRKAIAGEAG